MEINSMSRSYQILEILLPWTLICIPLYVLFCSLKVQNAIDYLKIIGALDNKENLTVLGVDSILFSLALNLFLIISTVTWTLVCHPHPSGKHLSVLPVEPKLGKMLILGAIFNCLDPIMTIVAGLSVRDPFLMPSDKKDVSLLTHNSKAFIIYLMRGWFP